MTTRPAPLTGQDGVVRCGWAGEDAEYQRYHDEEWGRALHGDRALFEKLSLEGFQAGLSWITILRRRDAFRAAFADFEPGVVAEFGPGEVEALMADPGIIRNRAKIEATVANARIVAENVADDPGALDRIIWSAVPAEHIRPREWPDLPATSPESVALSARLRALGLRFVGPTTVYALMQSAGLVDDHFQGCWRAEAGLSAEAARTPPPA